MGNDGGVTAALPAEGPTDPAGVPATLVGQARAWVRDDPDPATRAELTALLDAALRGDTGAAAELADRFSGPLEFGTAGLRGRMGAGEHRMNRAVVIRAAAGLAAHVLAGGGRSLVVGYDARHTSDRLALDTCAVATAAGLQVWLLPRALPTPVLAFAIGHLGADAGVVVTASHNPPQDNGYKVYLGDGSQIVPPADTEISAAIAASGRVVDIPRSESGWTVLGEEVVTAYVERAVTVVPVDGPRDLRVVYTPLHGVGGDLLARTMERAGFAEPSVVEAQWLPDPDFPTVAFPNPEEPGAMDLALVLANLEGADLVLANDPDADRCAVGARFPGGWRMLTGDELGALLGEHVATRTDAAGSVLACSIVSSTMLGRIAERHGLAHAETLTGFKWIGRVPDLRFGYEEALGYCVDPVAVKDKDGITAALLAVELAATLKAAGRSLPDALDDLARQYGVHATGQLSVRVDDLAEIGDAMARLRSRPPAVLAGRAVESVDDLRDGADDLPPTDGLRYRLTGSARVIVRPSGTEPKLKAYLEVVEPVGSAGVGAARTVAEATVAALRNDIAEAAGLQTALTGVEVPATEPRAWWKRWLIYLVVAAVVIWVVRGLVGAVDWGAVWDAITLLDPAEGLLLLALLLLRQTFNAVPLSRFVHGLSLDLSIQNDLTANLVGTVAPPPGDFVIRVSQFRSWGIEPVRGMAGVTLNMLTFYAVRFLAPVVGLLFVGWQCLSRRDFVIAVLSGLAAAVVLLGLWFVLRGDRLAALVGRVAARVVGQFRRDVDAQRWADAVVDFGSQMAGTLREGLALSMLALLGMVLTDGMILLTALRAVGVSSDAVTSFDVLAAFLMAYPLTMFPLFGLGVLDAALLAALVAIGGDAVESQVVAALLIWRVVTIIGPLLLGFVALLLWRRGAGRDRPDPDVADSAPDAGGMEDSARTAGS